MGTAIDAAPAGVCTKGSEVVEAELPLGTAVAQSAPVHSGAHVQTAPVPPPATAHTPCALHAFAPHE